MCPDPCGTRLGSWFQLILKYIYTYFHHIFGVYMVRTFLKKCRMKLTCLASVYGLLETVRTVGGNRQYTVYSASSTNTAPPLTNTALDARQSSAPGCATSRLQHHAPSVDSADLLLLLLFITPEGSTTQHHHCKDRRKTQETKN